MVTDGNDVVDNVVDGEDDVDDDNDMLFRRSTLF